VFVWTVQVLDSTVIPIQRVLRPSGSGARVNWLGTAQQADVDDESGRMRMPNLEHAHFLGAPPPSQTIVVVELYGPKGEQVNGTRDIVRNISECVLCVVTVGEEGATASRKPSAGLPLQRRALCPKRSM
jgi:hypothetical protein